MTCTISLTTEEANFITLTSPIKLSKKQATFLKTQYGETQLSALRATIEKDEEELAKLRPGTENEMVLKRKLEEKRKQLTAYKKFSDALKACIAGRNYDSDQPERPNEPGPSKPERPNEPGPSKPERPNEPGPSKPERPNEPGPSKPERPNEPGPSKPERPNEPERPNNPERERALPSTNGAVIGVIVAVLGILIAALPVIKSMLPAQLRALLP